MGEDVKFQTGKMGKEPRAMTPHERESWRRQITGNAKEYLFSIGQPLVYKRDDGRVVAEHRDGKILIVR